MYIYNTLLFHSYGIIRFYAVKNHEIIHSE